MRYTTFANAADSYKVGHRPMYPKGMTRLLSNWTARSSRVSTIDHVVPFGIQAAIKSILVDFMNESFFRKKPDEAFDQHKRRVEGLLGMEFDDSHWRELHKLGYAPLEIRAIPEGTRVPLRVPFLLIENTHDDFAWFVNYIESILSTEIWLPITSATMALHFRQMLDSYAAWTSSNPAFVDWQGHDFSFRGMCGLNGAAMSGAGHLLSFAGSDMLPAMDWAEYYYDAKGFVGGSVPASEHSVMCAGGELGEIETFEHIMTAFPTGIVSIVSDTWDLWKVLTDVIPSLKNRIMARNGKLVIRPDSGDPVLILCGDPDAEPGSPASKGVVQLLHEAIGGTTNDKGYIELDPHIGTIYGDAITFERAERICRLLMEKGYASTNVVLGIGSFTYQYVTRDTFGMAMKATWCMVDGEARPMFKDPVTDKSGKRSAKGRIAVLESNDTLELIENATPEQEAASALIPIWRDGKFLKKYTYREIAQRVGVRKILPD